MRTTVGTKIDVGDVVSKATSLLMANPAIILIQVIPAIPSLLSDLLSRSSILSPVSLLASIVSVVLTVIASGAYPPLVKEAVAGQRLTLSESLGRAAQRFWSLVAAGILVVLIVLLGSIAFIVPGIIFATWYAYTVPAIMLENKGALEGMSASRAFGRDKKWSTFILFVVFFVVYLVVLLIGGVLSLGGGGSVIQTVLTIPLSAWTSVVLAYTYLTHGPQLQPQGAQPNWQQPSSPLTPGAGSVAPVTQGASFCASCGSPLAPGARFCTSCGAPT